MRLNLIEEIISLTSKTGHSRSRRFNKFRMLGDDTVLMSKDIETEYASHSIVKKLRLSLTVLILFAVYLTFVGKSLVLQYIHGYTNYILAEGNSVRAYKINADRGVIFDRDGNVLVRNNPAFSILLDIKTCSYEFRNYRECFLALELVSNFFDLGFEERSSLLERVENTSDVVPLATNVKKEDLLVLEPQLSKFSGVRILVLPVRDHLYGERASHLLGYTGFSPTSSEVVGKTGVEEQYNEYLTGIDGYKIVQVDSLGNEVSLLSETRPLPGRDLKLNIDIELQTLAYSLLEQKINDSTSKAEAGAVVIQDPQTGAILALVSYPSYDPNPLIQGISSEQLRTLNSDPRSPFFNRAISAAYPPGSVFKMITASAVLMEKIVPENFQIFDKGYIEVAGFIFRNWKLDGHGLVDLRRALQVSNDTYFYTVTGGYGGVKGLGIKRLHDWAENFGIGKKTGVDLPGEVAGYMPNGEGREWYLGDDYISSIGQGDILATPLQMNNMVTYFANGGYLYVPRVVKNIEGSPEFDPKIIRNFIVDEKTYRIVREGMHLSVIPGGTGYPVYDIPEKFGVQLAGKTGTSEYIDRNGEERTHAWFSVFGPYDKDDYELADIAITVFLEGGGGGSSDAAPLARELLGNWLERSP